MSTQPQTDWTDNQTEQTTRLNRQTLNSQTDWSDRTAQGSTVREGDGIDTMLTIGATGATKHSDNQGQGWRSLHWEFPSDVMWSQRSHWEKSINQLYQDTTKAKTERTGRGVVQNAHTQHTQHMKCNGMTSIEWTLMKTSTNQLRLTC